MPKPDGKRPPGGIMMKITWLTRTTSRFSTLTWGPVSPNLQHANCDWQHETICKFSNATVVTHSCIWESPVENHFCETAPQLHTWTETSLTKYWFSTMSKPLHKHKVLHFGSLSMYATIMPQDPKKRLLSNPDTAFCQPLSHVCYIIFFIFVCPVFPNLIGINLTW